MELSEESYINLKDNFSTLFHEYITFIKNYKYICDHFSRATSVFLEFASDFLKKKADLEALVLLTKIEYLLRLLADIDRVPFHQFCPPSFHPLQHQQQ